MSATKEKGAGSMTDGSQPLDVRLDPAKPVGLRPSVNQMIRPEVNP